MRAPKLTYYLTVHNDRVRFRSRKPVRLNEPVSITVSDMVWTLTPKAIGWEGDRLVVGGVVR